jgi:putative ABC transport system permease protein
MRAIRALLHRLRNTFRRDHANGDIDEEVRFHLAMETEAGLRTGLGPVEAKARAYRAFGGVDRYTEETREERRLPWVDALRQDVRFAWRVLRRSPGYAVVAVATLALGIGANTAIFSVVNGVLLRPLPFAEADRLVMVWETDRASETLHEPGSLPDIRDFQARSRTLESLGGLVAIDVTLTDADEATRIGGLAVDDEVVTLLGVRPLLGRTFTAEEAAPGGARVLVLSEGFWRARFGGASSVLGSTLTLDGEPWTVVGVLPAAADLGIAQIHGRADYSAPFRGPRTSFWLPLQASVEQYPRQTHPFLTLGRLAAGADIGTAQEELAGIAADLEAAYPENEARGVNLEPFDEVVFGPVRPALLVLLGAVGLVLLITCANVANVLLARTLARGREVAVRRALGAPTRSVARQFLVESLLLTGLGTAAGVFLADRGLKMIVAVAPAGIPRLDVATVDGRVLAFTAGIAALVAVAFAMLPVLYARRLDIQRALQTQPGRRVSEGRGGRRFRSALVVAEVALAVSLVIGASLLLRSFWQLRAVDPGFRTGNVLKAEYQLPASRYPMDYSVYPNFPRINSFHAELLREVRALPGVRAAALTARHPLDAGFTNSFAIIGREAESADFPEIRTRIITPGYLETLGIPLIAGRDLRDGDDVAATPVILVNRAAVDRYFGGGDPLGQQIAFWGTPRQIVGVIGDEKFSGVQNAAEPAVYAPYPQAPQSSATIVLRAEGDPVALIPAVRERLRARDAQLALSGAEPLATTLASTIAQPRFTAVLLGLFAGVAILLALIGVHGVLSYTVAQRTHEMGIRVALGASRGEVVRMVVGEGMALAGIGIALGVVAAFAFSRVLAGLLFGISATDGATFIAVVGAITAVALLASYLPARRATSVSPMVALRND